MAQWFKTSVRFDKMLENGTVKKVTEPYLVDALSFTEAEARIIEEVTPYISGDFTVSAVKKSKIAEIFWDESGDKFYLAKVAFIAIDERTAKEKRTVSQWLIGGTDFNDAYEIVIREIVQYTAYAEIVGLTESPIVGYIPAKL